MPREYPPHPYAEIFPLRADQSLIELSDSIAQHGQKEEIVLFEGKVLDGRRRQAAAVRAAKKPLYRQFGSRPTDGEDALEFVFAVNYHRRDDMTKAEKVLVAVAYANLKRGSNQHTEVPPNGGTSKPPTSQKQAAEKLGVSRRDVERGKVVMDKGVPELQEAMRTEKVSISDAAAIADQPAEVQRKAVEAVEQGKARTLKGAIELDQGPRPEDAARIARELRGLVDRLGRVQTEQVKARDLARDGLQKALALIERL